jgi:hypothetical protein
VAGFTEKWSLSFERLGVFVDARLPSLDRSLALNHFELSSALGPISFAFDDLLRRFCNGISDPPEDVGVRLMVGLINESTIRVVGFLANGSSTVISRDARTSPIEKRVASSETLGLILGAVYELSRGDSPATIKSLAEHRKTNHLSARILRKVLDHASRDRLVWVISAPHQAGRVGKPPKAYHLTNEGVRALDEAESELLTTRRRRQPS